MFYYPYYAYLESLLISLSLGIFLAAAYAVIAWVLRPKAGVEG